MSKLAGKIRPEFWFVAAMMVAACGGGGGEGGSGAGNPGFVPITTTQTANLVGSAIGDASARLVSSGTYNNTVVNGSSGGSATVTGTESFSGSQSCGSSCVTSSNSANLTITFNDYYAPPTPAHTNSKVRLTGTVTFTDNRSSTQNGLSFSSSGQQRVIATSSLNVRLEITDTTGTYGYADTVQSMNVFGTGVTWDGSLRPSNGTNYSF